MKRIFALLGAGCLAASAAPAAPAAAGEAPRARFTISADCSYSASLFYLIDNASGAPGGQAWPYYKAFWEKEFGISEEDKKKFAAYCAVREKYLLQPKNSRYRLSEKWPLLFAGNASLDGAWKKADLYLADGDVAELRGIFAHFDAKFRPYWDAHAGNLCAAAAEFGKDGWAAKITGFLGETARFYELPAGLERDYLVTLLWHPGKRISGMMHGTRLGRLMLVELPEDQELRGQLDVITHEMLHDLFEFMPERARADAVAGMMEKDPGSAGVFLQNMDEGFATALANGLFASRHLPGSFKPEGRWYDERTVDSFAKAVYPEAVKAMAEGAGLGSRGAALGAALRELASASVLQDHFRSHVLITAPEARELAQPLMAALDVNDVHYFNLDESPGPEVGRLMEEKKFRPVVLAGEPASLPLLLASLPEGSLDAGRAAGLGEKAKGGGLLALLRGRSGRPFLFLLGGREAIAASLGKLKGVGCCSSEFSVPLAGLKPAR